MRKELDSLSVIYNALGQFTSIARYKQLSGGSGNEVVTANYSYDTRRRLMGWLRSALGSRADTSSPTAAGYTKRQA